ncbi:hypothetical protein Vretimale_4860 [Volvox reticuliferus]|uniref:Uncharacterized protein n=1 Tax=Volvox reticuliferus TaxID=1737510 RepID=A0A8J4DC69_9CHLO|nr:hypothetical protein Vretifemale_3485 [Volvox reticuliferus]GIL99718.1 hypothetical protein Vretimale_4860 [Volvox reticuliferus]
MATAVGTNALGIDANNFFTRGAAGQTDNVGKSMVQLHAEQMQLEKENNALQKLAILLPQLGFFSRVMALRETNWDVDKALALLRRFVAENDVKLKSFQKKRRKVQQQLEKKHQDEPSISGSSDSSGDSSDSGGDSGSDSEDGERKKRKRGDKAKHRSSKKKRSKDKEKKKRKGKDKPAARTLTHSEDFGKYGLIRESDAYAKRNEFILWALDVKKTDVENLGKFEERDLFKDYMEDYNTGTLPHRKYYDLEAYERARAAKAAAKGAKMDAKKGALNDEEALRQQKAEERQRLAAERMVNAYREIKYSDKGQDMREQEMLRAQMALAYKTGDVSKAHRLLDRLQPDELKKK